jgi:membrane associated rhomboid family serine protease
MARESREWSIPAPVRALLWWPAISFVLVIVAPDAAVGAIVIAGAALALVGGLVAAATRRMRRQHDRSMETSPTMEFPTLEIPQVDRPRGRSAA